MTKSERDYCLLFEPDGDTNGNLATLALEADNNLSQVKGILLDLMQQASAPNNTLDLKHTNDYFDAHPEHFTCPECNAPHVKVDEDGCCSACGTDAIIEDCTCGTPKPVDVPEYIAKIGAFEEASSKVDGTVTS